MRMRLLGIILMSLLLASCAESVHQHERLGLGRDSFRMPVEASDSSRATGFVRSVSVPAGERPPASSLMTAGEVVSLSGIVLKAKRLDGMTEVEVLQLPLEADGRPTGDRRQSQGRFLARQTTFLDPAILATGPTVTVQGVVEGVVERPLEPGSDDYAYPVIAVQDLTIWPQELLQPSGAVALRPTGLADTAQADAAAGSSLDFLGAILQGFGRALFMPNQYDSWRHYRSPSYTPDYSSRSSPSSNPLPAQKDIPPQFRKHNP